MTVIIKTQEEFEALIDKNNNIIIGDHLVINCDIDIKANIEAGNIEARNIKAWNIDAFDIKAHNIMAEKIDYYAFCIARESLKCKTIEGGRQNALHACLDQPIKYIK